MVNRGNIFSLIPWEGIQCSHQGFPFLIVTEHLWPWLPSVLGLQIPSDIASIFGTLQKAHWEEPLVWVSTICHPLCSLHPLNLWRRTRTHSGLRSYPGTPIHPNLIRVEQCVKHDIHIKPISNKLELLGKLIV